MFWCGKITGHHSGTPDLYGSSSLSLKKHTRIMQNPIFSLKNVTCLWGKLNGHHSATPDLYGWFIRSLSCEHTRIKTLVFPEYRSCDSRIKILCFHNKDHRSCASRIQILCIHNADIVQYASMHHFRHVWTTFKASMGKFFSS